MDEDILELLYSYLSDGIAGKTTEPYGRFDLNIFRKETTFNSLLIPFFSKRSLLIEQWRIEEPNT